MTKPQALALYRAADAGAGQPGSRKRWKAAARALGQLTTDATGLQALTKAESTHARADWREAARALHAAVTGEARPAPKIKPEPRPATLCEFLSRAGGLQDAGGDLKAMDAHLWHRDAPFRRRLVNPAGLNLDYAADLAHERGYFDDVPNPAWDSADNQHPVTVRMLLDAIRAELAGKPLTPGLGEVAPYVEPEGPDYEAAWEEAHPEDAPVRTYPIPSFAEGFSGWRA